VTLYVKESFVNKTEGYMFSESDVTESYCETPGEVYREAQKEYGRCVGACYVDSDGAPKKVGWVFQGRSQYEDTGETYLREVWVEVHTAPPTRTVQNHFAEL
jgi:hypothetical protein